MATEKPQQHPGSDGAWDPVHYLRHADERGRPFVELLARVGLTDPTDPNDVVDLGCGPGNLTAVLQQRWPRARVVGVDDSPEMVAAARARPGLDVVEADLGTWLAEAGPGVVDLLVSNATLQWLPDPLAVLPDLVAAVRPGGWLAIGVPANFDEPSHVLREELAADPRFVAHTAGVSRPGAPRVEAWWQALHDLGCTVDAWETRYLHVLRGPDPVFDWVSATGARPTLAALPEPLREQFAEEYRAALRRAYPERDGVTVLPFRRSFVVARVPA